ncbi:MAG: aminotransferase class IV [Planctomycetota bacterium]
MTRAVWIDGAFVDGGRGATRGGADDGVALFETMGVWRGDLPLWERHVARLRGGLLRLGVAHVGDDDASLRRAADELLRHNAGDDVVRLCCRPRPRGHSRELTTRRRADSPWAAGEGGDGVVRLLPTVARRAPGEPPADLKAEPRGFYDAVLREARAGTAADGVVLGDDGAVLETALGTLWLHLDAVWTTPALDGRVLPGVARGLLLERARAAGVPVAERRCDLGDLHRADALCVSNAVFGVRPAALVGAPVELHSALRRLWPFAGGG